MDLSLISSNIASSLNLDDRPQLEGVGPQFYNDVLTVIEGKLRDRVDNLLGQKRRNGSLITETCISETIKYAVNNMLEWPDIISETAYYYRKKYALAM